MYDILQIHTPKEETTETTTTYMNLDQIGQLGKKKIQQGYGYLLTFSWLCYEQSKYMHIFCHIKYGKITTLRWDIITDIHCTIL